MIKTFGATAALIFLASAADASDIPILTGVSAVGSDYLFNYQATLSADQGLSAGDLLAIIDFNGYVPGSVASTNADWTAAVSNTLPPGLIAQPGVIDSATIPDLVFTYIGPDFHVSNGPYPSQTDYAGLSALSIYGDTVYGHFSAVAVKNTGDTQNTVTYNVGSVAVPTPVPEPAVWAMLIVGFAGTGAALRRRRGIVAGA